ncbi:BamA/TamA family outer membrane protein [Gracilimonas sp.]|uniref:BamA/TamA family outer membrane protein n=1 Tax=Gracilimonas sp. TaxID=1974203 RepID=UPI002870BE79|nr:BamA/TamA family outer membrane protein [Gracilimonas sp.]
MSTDTVDVAFLPALAYNSDMGLIGGGLVSRYHYKNGIRPFYSYLNLNAVASTKGVISSSIFYDKPKVFDSTRRLTTEIYLSRFLQNQYYGIGNYTILPDAPEDNSDYYLYQSFLAGFEVILRSPIFNKSSQSKLDVYTSVNFDYRTLFGNNDSRLIGIQAPLGIDHFRTASLGGGIVWENRNSEFNPTRGNYAKAGIEVGQKAFGSNSNFVRAETEIRTYQSFHLLRNITFANRLSFVHTSGNLPYWKLAEIGGEKTMRGYPENRFLDNNAILLNSELRTWLWEFPAYSVKLGGTLFFDVGRTFSNNATLDNVFNDLKFTYGFGGNSSFFNENFIFRGDVGFSEEGYGIYFTAGYLF